MLLLSGKASMLLLEGFHCLLSVHQCTGCCCCSLFFLPQGVGEGINALLITVKLSQTQMQAVVVELVHQCLVPLGLKKQ